MPTVLITGGTGFIGRALSRSLLDKGFDVIIITRKPEEHSKSTQGMTYAGWDFEKQTMDSAAIEKADHIIHLAGAGVADKRWTNKRKEELFESRVKSSEMIVTALKNFPNKVKTVISISGIGWYGPDSQIPNPRPFIESDPPSNDFLGELCHQWEASISPVLLLGKRLIIFRSGIVLSEDGGALKEFLKPLRFGIASIMGNGKQTVSWIHREDLVNLFMFAIQNESLNGIYNAVSPSPVSNKELILQLSRSRKKWFIPFHIPAFILKSLLGEMSVELLKSTTVSSGKIRKAGFLFQLSDIKSALLDSSIK